MKDIKRHISMVEMLLALYKKDRRSSPLSNVSCLQIDSIQAVLDVAKTFNDLLNSMDRLIPSEEGE